MASRNGDFVHWGPETLRQRPFVPKKDSRYWTQQEHELFVRAITLFGPKPCKRIRDYMLVFVDNVKVRPKTLTQIRTHHQKWMIRMEKVLPVPILKEEPDIELSEFCVFEPNEYEPLEYESVPETPSLQCTEEIPSGCEDPAWLVCNEELEKEEEQPQVGVHLEEIESHWVRDSLCLPFY